MINQNFVLLGILINAAGSVSYIIDTARGNIKPNRVSFFLWSLAPLLAFAAALNQGVGIQSLMPLSVSLFPISIFIASFFNKKSFWKLTTFDLTCGALSLIGLLLWYITKVGNIAIFFSILADGLAALPTMVKAYKYPETEKSWPWLASTIGGFITLLSIKNWNFEQSGFPLYYTLTVLIIFIFVHFKIGKLSK